MVLALLLVILVQTPEGVCQKMVERYQRASQIPILNYGQGKGGARPVPFDSLVGYHGTSLASVDFHIRRGLDPEVPAMKTDFYFWPFISPRTNAVFKGLPQYSAHKYYMLGMRDAMRAAEAYADKGSDVAGYTGASADIHLVMGVDQAALQGRSIEMGRAESLILVNKKSVFPYIGIDFAKSGEGGLPLEGIHSLFVPTKEVGLLVRGFFEGRIDLWKRGGPKSPEELSTEGKGSPYAYEALLDLFRKSPGKFMKLAQENSESMKAAFRGFSSEQREAFQSSHPETFDYFLELYGADLGPQN